jgi:S1/P1 Nuclease
VLSKINNMIHSHPGYPGWIKGFSGSPEETARHAFIQAATWADDIKDSLSCRALHDVQPCYSDSIDASHPDIPNGPESARNIGTSDLLKHAYWHFHDAVFSDDGTPTPDQHAIDQSANALSEIQLMTKALSDPATSDDIKTYDLVWLVHLVGDAHQPLHGVARYSRGTLAGAHPADGDRGGNDENVVDASGAPLLDAEGHKENLHKFWDGLPGEGGTPEQAAAATGALPAPSATLVAESDPAIWFQEDAFIAEMVAYDAIPDTDRNASLTDAYQTTAHQIAKQRIALAGYRLASLLNTALK